MRPPGWADKWSIFGINSTFPDTAVNTVLETKGLLAVLFSPPSPNFIGVWMLGKVIKESLIPNLGTWLKPEYGLKVKNMVETMAVKRQWEASHWFEKVYYF